MPFSNKNIPAKDQRPVNPDVPDQRVPPAVQPHRFDHLIPPANQLLKITAKVTWKMMKLLVGAAFRIPGLIRRHTPKRRDKPAAQ